MNGLSESAINDVQAVLVDARTNHAKKAYYADGKHKGTRGPPRVPARHTRASARR